ncbi:solute carrier family 22 member 13-like [Sinocyclocheilus rhinocerous]|uniref:solute carrier family 22 member 13-like n=1 Tax=Sinocyclocheilus rhinocerous TaxID=307959 RepID=UPI0007BA564E|nr:PREDICTED: solute carrier family 22 member 13-like [Sinocyclocheilus rhinocerous]
MSNRTASEFFIGAHLRCLQYSYTNHHCNSDWILQVGSNLTKEEQLNLTLPRLSNGSFSPCQMYVPVDWDLSAIQEYGLNETTTCTDGWVHNDTIYEATIVTDFDLVCDNANLFRGAQTIFLAGVLVGAFIVGIALGGFRINSIILATEWIGVAQRSFAACLSQVLAALGQVMFLAVVYYVRDWRLDQFIMAGPLAFVVTYIWFIPESARWLLVRGRTTDAKELIQKAAAINKRTVPDSLVEKVLNEKPVERGGIKILFASRVLRKYFLSITFAWCALNLAYYSLSLNVGKFGLDIFLNQLIFGLSEIPVHFLCMWSLETVGRKVSLMAALIVGGSLCLLTLAVPQSNSIAVAALATCGRFLMNGAGSICNVYIQELFPTSIRQTAMGLGSTAARVASMLAPVVNMLEVYHFTIPTLVLGSLALASGITAFLLPETRRTELPGSTEEAEGKRETNTLSLYFSKGNQKWLTLHLEIVKTS